MRPLLQLKIILVIAHDNSGGIEVVIESLAFAKEFRSENNVGLLCPNRKFLPHGSRITHRERFNDHSRKEIPSDRMIIVVFRITLSN